MAERVLITGGAGFIGSHLADELASWLETQESPTASTGQPPSWPRED